MSTTSTVTGFEFPEDGMPERGQSLQDGGGSTGLSSSELRKVSEVRQRRLQDEEDSASRFVTGDELHELRQQVFNLRQELEEARQLRNKDRIHRLERAILDAQMMDAEFIYEISLERMEAAQRAGRFQEAERHRKEAMKARNALPQFNLEGLWVGKYGEHGFELINVTYSGDTLIATKLTGQKNVGKGQVTFQVDLSPKYRNNMILDPIELGTQAAGQWGAKFLSRFAGKGQVAAMDGSGAQWLDGQLIMVGDYFSFAWLPIGHQVFFGRPSAELTLKLLRASRSKAFKDNQVREHIQRCWEETEHLEDEMEVSGGSLDQQHYYHQEGCFE